MLVEAAWSYRYPARVAKNKAEILIWLPKAGARHSLEGAARLCDRYRTLTGQGQEIDRRRHRDRAGAVRIYMGDRPGSETRDAIGFARSACWPGAGRNG